jgi:hypothetical protein
MIRFVPLFAVLVLVAFGPSASAGFIYTFNTDPFAGSTALTTPGRQVVGNELFIPTFAAHDLFSFDGGVFGAYGVAAPVQFFNGLASNLPTGGPNVIVLQDSDNDSNPATAFNAGSAANLIAAGIDTPGAGFFVYFNSSLGLNRLVFSTNLSDPTADLKILARINTPSGLGAINALPSFSASNFQITTVPGPASAVLFLVGAVAGIPIAVRRVAGRTMRPVVCS